MLSVSILVTEIILSIFQLPNYTRKKRYESLNSVVAIIEFVHVYPARQIASTAKLPGLTLCDKFLCKKYTAPLDKGYV